VTAHVLRADKVHEDPLANITIPPGDRVKVTVPVGDEPPDTTTSHVEGSLILMDGGEQFTVVIGGAVIVSGAALTVALD
jgi:hypothetical protein